MRISRVYTRAGDGGRTRLVGGREVEKDDARVEAYGTIDELNSVIGVARSFNQHTPTKPEVTDQIEQMLRTVQNDLFNIGADLATPEADRHESMYRVGDTDVSRLEEWCDELTESLGPLQEFILPGGGKVGAFLHQARTVCRRAERCIVTLMRSNDDVDAGSLRYVNRLSDLLFVLSRWASRATGEPEFLWEKPS